MRPTVQQFAGFRKVATVRHYCDIFRRASRGMTTREIATELGLTPRYVSAAQRDLGFDSELPPPAFVQIDAQIETMS